MTLPEWTIAELQTQMAASELTSEQVTGLYIQRIEEVDQGGPSVNSVIEVNPDALAIARELDTDRRSGYVRGPLHGIPILLKDNIDTGDRMQTTAGSLALEGNFAARDAFIVERLRYAGAVVLGKTNLSEWANFRGNPSVSGWSSRGGLTRNPYVLDRSASGSSSGSGAAVAANLAMVAVGTETDGSIVWPAQSNGIVGVKPTVGLLSRSGIIPIAHSQDTPGPMARTVTDAAILLAAMAGEDSADPATASGRPAAADYTGSLRLDALKGARIGVARSLAGTHPKVTRILEDSLAVMRDLGAVIIDPADVPHSDELESTEVEVLLYEFKVGLNAYLAARSGHARVRSLEDVIAFNEAHADRVLQYFGQEWMLAAQEKGPLTEDRYRNALARNHRLTREEGIDQVMRVHNLEALVTVSGAPAALIDLVNGDPSNDAVTSSSPAAVAGYPHITVPGGFVSGLPVGVSFFGGAWQELRLIRYAYAFEQATCHRRSPGFLPTAVTI